jgi:amidase
LVLSHRDWHQAGRIRDAVANQWHAFFRDWDVVLCPIMPIPAFLHDHRPMEKREISIDGAQVEYGRLSMWAGIATLSGQSATAMPLGLGSSGLPIGMQIVGPYLEDRTTIAFAGLIEREFGGFAPPPGY